MRFSASLKSLLPLVLASAFGWNTSAKALDHLTVQMAFYPQGPQAYLFLAQKKGWFQQAGLDVQVLDGRGSNYSMQVLSSGHADVGEGMLSPIGPARDRGAKVKVIAEWINKDGPAIIVPADSGITGPAGLKGKKLGIIASGTWPPLLDSFFKKFGMSQNDMQLVYLDSTALFTSYASKNLDGMLTVDLAYTEANPLRPSIRFSALNYGVKLPGYGLYATEDTIAQRSDVLKRFIQVCAKTMTYIYNGHEEEAAEAIRQERPNAKLPVPLMTSQIKFYTFLRFSDATKGKPPGWQSPKEWDERVAYMKSVGMIKGDAVSKDFYTNAFTEGATQ